MLRRSVEEFGAHVSQIRDDQWEAGTPDTEWNVRDLVNHVLAENLLNSLGHLCPGFAQSSR